MAKSVNKVILLGNVGKDPEFRSLPSGDSVANLSLATNERFKDNQGEWQDRAEWHSLVAFQKTADIIREYVRKGSKLYIEGRLRTQSWDDKATNQRKYRTEIVVHELTLLSSASINDGSQRRSEPAEPAQDRHYPDTEITDEDIPF